MSRIVLIISLAWFLKVFEGLVDEYKVQNGGTVGVCRVLENVTLFPPVLFKLLLSVDFWESYAVPPGPLLRTFEFLR